MQGFDLPEALGNALRIELIFPATLVAVPLLLLNFGGSRDTISVGFALLIILNIAYSLVGAAIEGSIDVIELQRRAAGDARRDRRLRLAVSPICRAASARLGVDRRCSASIALPTAWAQMKSYPHQNLEQAFTRAIAHR